MKCILKSNAKINLGLNVIKKRTDNYHELKMILAPINLYDNLIINFKNELGEITLKSNLKKLELDNKNTIILAYNYFYQESNIKKRKIDIFLEKNIPHMAGLGGGSSNAATLLKFLNKMHNDIFLTDDLMKIGLKIGADVPFFIINKTAIVKGIGEKIEVIENNLECDIIVAKPKFGISTKEAFDSLNLKSLKEKNSIEKIIVGLRENDLRMVNENLENDIQQNLLLTNLEIIVIDKITEEIGKSFLMSGSGSSYFLLSEFEESNKILLKLKKCVKIDMVFKCSFLK